MLQGTAVKNLPSLQSYPVLLGYVLLQSRAIFPHKEHYVAMLYHFAIEQIFSLCTDINDVLPLSCFISLHSLFFFQISSYFAIVQLLTSSLVFFMLLASHWDYLIIQIFSYTLPSSDSLEPLSDPFSWSFLHYNSCILMHEEH